MYFEKNDQDFLFFLLSDSRGFAKMGILFRKWLKTVSFFFHFQKLVAFLVDFPENMGQRCVRRQSRITREKIEWEQVRKK